MYRIENNEKFNICINNNKIDLSMTAEEMFEKLGYKRKEAKEEIKYFKNDKIIRFHKKLKFIHTWNEQEMQDFEDCSETIDIKELKAINKQVEELGWK